MSDRQRDDTQLLDRDARREGESVEQELPRANRQLNPAPTRRVGTADNGRGRSAETPSAIPRRGWTDIVVRVYTGIADDRVLANAAAVSFYALLSLFPAIAALVSVYGLFADPATIEQHLDTVAGILPGGAIDVIRDQLDRLAAQPRGTLGISFLVGLVISLWSANGGIKALFDALNVVYEKPEQRSFVRLNVITLIFTLAMIGFLIVALAGIVALPVALDYLPEFVGEILNIARWPALLVLVALALNCIYCYGPSRDRPRWRWLSWGGVFAAVAWLGFSAIFSFYAANFGNFNKTYGSLGAVIGFMTWMWLSVAVLLIGGKLNAELEPDSTKTNG